MKKMIVMSLGAGVLLFSSCDQNQNRSTENSTINESATTASGGMQATETELSGQDAQFRDQASSTSMRLGTDLQLDESSRDRAGEVYYKRAQQRAQLQQKYASDTTGMAQEMRTMDDDTDRQLRDILTSDQYRSYEQNRANYADQDQMNMNRADTDRSGGMSPDSRSMNSDAGSGQMNQGAGAGTHTNPGMDAQTHTGSHQSPGTGAQGNR